MRQYDESLYQGASYRAGSYGPYSYRTGSYRTMKTEETRRTSPHHSMLLFISAFVGVHLFLACHMPQVEKVFFDSNTLPSECKEKIPAM